MYKTNQKGGIAIIIIILAVVGVLGVTLLNKGDKKDDLDNKEEVMMEKNDEAMLGDGAMMEEKEGDGVMMEKESGKYVAYDSSLLKNAENGKVVIFFHASWCPTCRLQDTAILESIKDIPGDVTILKANYDKETELKKKYGVTTQHTFVQVDAQGNLITKWTGGTDLDGIVSKLK